MEFARTVPDAHQAVRTPVDLHAIARFKGQFEVSLVANRSHRGDEVMQDGSGACVTVFRAQALKDLHSGVRMFFQPGDDQIFIGIQFAWAPGSLAARFVAGFIEPFADGLDIASGLFGNLSRSQLQLPVQTAHLVIGFKVDHFLAPCFCRKSSTIALSDRGLMAPIGWGSEADPVRCPGWLLFSGSSLSRLRS